MKKYAKLLIAFVLVLSAFLLAGCSIINHLEYELIDDSYYEVSGFFEIYPSKKVNIPAEYKGLPVKSIGTDAFLSSSGLTSITIPDSVTSIGEGAFFGCSDLVSPFRAVLRALTCLRSLVAVA